MTISADAILEYFRDSLDVQTDGIQPDSALFSSGVIDSFALVSLLTFLESSCDIRIAPQDVNLDNFDSIERMMAYLERARIDS